MVFLSAYLRESLHAARQNVAKEIDFLFRVQVRKTDAERRVDVLLGKAEREECGAEVFRSRRARGAFRNAYTLARKKTHQSFTLYTRDGYIQYIGKPCFPAETNRTA